MITIILPKREGFSETRHGAIALFVQDMVANSIFKPTITILRGDDHLPAFPGFKVLTQNTKRRFIERSSSAYYRFCLRHIDETNPKLVEVHNRPSCVRYLLRRNPNLCISLVLHNDPDTMPELKSIAARQWILDHTKAVFCVSDYVKERFCASLQGSINHVVVIPNGILMPPPPPPKEKLILYVGRLNESKGTHIFANALARVLPYFPEWHACVIGATRHEKDHHQSPFESSLRATLAPITNQVTFTGYLPHQSLASTYAKTSIVVVPSLWNEAFGRVALEGLAHGCAVVASKRGGIPQVIGNAGILFEPTDPQALPTILQGLLSDPASLLHCRKDARAQASRFDLKQVTQQLDEQYRYLLTN